MEIIEQDAREKGRLTEKERLELVEKKVEIQKKRLEVKKEKMTMDTISLY